MHIGIAHITFEQHKNESREKQLIYLLFHAKEVLDKIATKHEKEQYKDNGRTGMGI